MGVEFRQRSLGELFSMIWRQKLMVLLPTLVVTISVAWVVSSLPSVYESTSLLKITPPAISFNVIGSLSDEDVSQRLTGITEEVKSRNALEPMVAKYKLFEEERANGVPMELLIERMRNNIKVELKDKTSDDKVPAFTVSYRDRVPEAARNVTAELASKFVNAQTAQAMVESKATQEFFAKQLSESKAKLDAIDSQRLNYMLQNVEKLPSGAAGLIAQLNGFHEQLKTSADREKTIQTEIGRMRDNRTLLERQKTQIRDIGDKEAVERERYLSDPTRSPAYAELVKRKTELKSQLQNLLTQYKPKHPDVIAKQNEIETVEKDISELLEKAKSNIAEVRESSKGRLDLQIQSIENEQQRIAGEIGRQEQALAQVRTEAAQARQMLGDLQRRIESIPNAEVALEAFNRDYQTAKGTYDELLKKTNDADLQAKRTENQQGETIRVVDAASLPQTPVNAAKRPMLIFGGALIGLIIGFFIAGIFEFPKLLTIQNADDAKHYTGLPVLASVPELLTPQESRWRVTFGLVKASAAIAIAVASVPILIFVLQATRIFDRFVS
ncbi:MAG TPA: GNVR domain-containing protein [Pyrinomonadaceae bacterium]|jgi:polysaccharide chain length determinant protein (PEP-CTERM system associated)|nr:GNVR domain-containing protein [Pyrinomonadaceae bacterium]